MNNYPDPEQEAQSSTFKTPLANEVLMTNFIIKRS